MLYGRYPVNKERKNKVEDKEQEESIETFYITKFPPDTFQMSIVNPISSTQCSCAVESMEKELMIKVIPTITLNLTVHPLPMIKWW